MSASRPPTDESEPANRFPNLAPAPPSLATSTQQQTAKSSSPPVPSSWTSQSPALAPAIGPSAGFSDFSATTAEILNRIRSGNTGHAAGTPAFEAKRAEVLQSYVTSDKLPTPPPIANTGRRGRGGRVGTPSQLKTDFTASPAPGATPTSARGSGRGRGRGRGRGGRGSGKRKRSESISSDDDSDISSSYTPLPTKTKSGRNVKQPVVFVPTIPEPTREVKRRRSTKAVLAAQCTVCHRGTDPGNNRIVFCDTCNTAYHQYCHDPPIDNEVVNVLEKEWLCGPCERSKKNAVEGSEGLVAGSGLSIDEKRAYFSGLPHVRLVSLLLHASIRHPELPLFPPHIQDPQSSLPASQSHSQSQPQSQLQPNPQSQIPTSQPTPALKPAPPPAQAPTSQPTATKPSASPSAPPNGLSSRNSNTRSGTSTTSDIDPAEAQLLGEIRRSHNEHHKPSPASNTSAPVATTAAGGATATTTADATAEAGAGADEDAVADEYDDGYDTDPPAHYPKPGNGLARTLKSESEDLAWLVDDNFEVFSHHMWKGDSSAATGVASSSSGVVGLNGQQQQSGGGSASASQAMYKSL